MRLFGDDSRTFGNRFSRIIRHSSPDAGRFRSAPLIRAAFASSARFLI